MTAPFEFDTRAERDAIQAAHPMRTKRFDLYDEAMRLVGERHAKGDLVDLVNWLLLTNVLALEHIAALTAKLAAAENAVAACEAASKRYEREDRVSPPYGNGCYHPSHDHLFSDADDAIATYRGTK